MPSLSWELSFSIICMRCTDKGSSLNLDLRNTGNCVVIMIMLNICICISISICICICMYVCMNASV